MISKERILRMQNDIYYVEKSKCAEVVSMARGNPNSISLYDAINYDKEKDEFRINFIDRVVFIANGPREQMIEILQNIG